MPKIFAVQDGGFVCLAGDAPVGGSVNEDCAAGLGKILNKFRCIAVPSVFRNELYRSCLESRIDFVFVFGRCECKPDYKEEDD